ncbi:ABC transporter permease [Marinomonas algarum]|uniref:FtsX-like permease family protein n=1 Tax=Marinomonas algarum TaxID=2883105 RepID=A0A9X1ILX8_9GAMM|nr:FtsX-like permease family protein [Marinomonas algarum]MCB5161692.1 FtsX-like permease family protein [Marinomonas algarum]
MLIKLAWRNIWRNPLRTLILLGVMIFGLMSVIAMMGLMNSFYSNMINNAIKWQTSHLKIHDSRYPDDPDIHFTVSHLSQLKAELDQQSLVHAWSGRHLVNGMIASARSVRGVTINGIDPLTKVTPLKARITEGEWLNDLGRNPILVSQKTSERLNLRVGSKVVLTFNDDKGALTGGAFRVKGLFKTPSSTMDDNHVYVRKGDLSKLSGIKGVHEVAILLNNPEEAPRFVNTLAQSFAPDIREQWLIRDWQTLNPVLKTMADSAEVFNRVFLLIFVVAMMFGIVNIVLMSVFERTREFGVLMAVGMSKRHIRFLIMLESGLMGVGGTTLGLIGGILLVSYFQSTGMDLSQFGDGLNGLGIDSVLYPSVSFQEYAMAFIAVSLATLLSGLYPAHQILKYNPVDAMSEKH